MALLDKLISFSLPLMLSGILQLMFNAVDIIVVGNFTGSQALAAVGSTTSLINLFINLFIGISLGANVLAARYYAAGRDKEAEGLAGGGGALSSSGISSPSSVSIFSSFSISYRSYRTSSLYRPSEEPDRPEPKEKPPKTACQCPLSAPLAAWCRPLADSSDSSVWDGN